MPDPRRQDPLSFLHNSQYIAKVRLAGVGDQAQEFRQYGALFRASDGDADTLWRKQASQQHVQACLRTIIGEHNTLRKVRQAST